MQSLTRAVISRISVLTPVMDISEQMPPVKPFEIKPALMVRGLRMVPLMLVGTMFMAGMAPTAAEGSDGSFSFAGVVGGLARVAINYGRMISDIRYGALEVDGERGMLTLRDLTVDGLGNYANCHVSLGRLQISGINLWGAEDLRSRLDVADLGISTNCFGASAAMIGMWAGGDTISVERLSVDMHQVNSSGAVNVDIEAVSPGIAQIEGSADFDYAAFISPALIDQIGGGWRNRIVPDDFVDETGEPIDPEDMDPEVFSDIYDRRFEPEGGLRATLRSAHLSVEDLGLWQRVRPILPPAAISPEGVTAGIVIAEPGSALEAVQQSLAQAITAFVANPGRLTAEIHPAQPVTFQTDDWEKPEEALTLLQPRFTNALPTPASALIADPEDLSADPFALGIAFAEGRGMPQNTQRAIMLLRPLEDNAAAMLAVARLTVETDPAAAYAQALKAADIGAVGVAALLDGIEAKITTEALLDAQLSADEELPDEVFASVPAMRLAASAYEQGEDAPRSYALAWRIAASAAAAGDGASKALMARLEARFSADPAWQKTREKAADLALDDWTERGLAARLAGQ